jgi:hypothetical protein
MDRRPHRLTLFLCRGAGDVDVGAICCFPPAQDVPSAPARFVHPLSWTFG